MSEIQLNRKVEIWNLSKLKPYANNARKHPDSQIEQIVTSIKKFGWTNPILVDSESGIIAGHGRLEAAKRVGLKKVPVIILDGLTEDERKACVIADNKIAENAHWDFEILGEELASLKGVNFDMEVLGFDEKEIDRLIAEFENGSPIDEDEGEQEIPTEKLDRVSVRVGELKMKIDARRYIDFESKLKSKVGIDPEKQKAEILRRLKI